MGVIVREKNKGSGIWWLFVNHSGGRWSKKIGSRATAVQMKREIERRVVTGDLQLAKKSAPSLRDCGRRWLNEFIHERRSQLTYTRYKGILEQHLKDIGSIQIDKLTRGDIRSLLLQKFKAGYSPSSIGLMLNVIHGICSYALDDELIKSNPASGLSRGLDINRDKKQEDIDPLTREEMQEVLECIKTNWPQYYLWFLTASRTGARLGEICALEWEDIDWKRKTVRISKTAKDQTVKLSTKTYSIRKAQMSDQLIEEIRRHKKADARECLKEGVQQKYIFRTGDKLLSQSTIRRIWDRALKKCGMRHRRVHDIRHSTASTLLSSGADLAAVSKLLGHSSPKITLDVYYHYMPSRNEGFTNLLDDQKTTDYKPNGNGGEQGAYRVQLK